MKVIEFYIEDDLRNKGQKLLVAVDELGGKHVVSGNPYFPTALIPYEECWYTTKPKPNAEQSH